MILLVNQAFPQTFVCPVKNAKKGDYNQESFWYYPWGKSGTHKGVDIFARIGTELRSSVNGIVIKTGSNEMGGLHVIVLDFKGRFHYFAHLNQIHTKIGDWVNAGEKIGTTGDSGNAKGKPAHLHYSIVSILPHFWKIDSDPQGYRKMFFINPIPYLNSTFEE